MIHTQKITPEKLEQYVGKNKALIEALESVEESVYVFDAIANKPLYVNRSILEILGYLPNQIKKMGTKWSELVVHPEDYPHLSNHILNYAKLSPGARSRVVYRVKDAKGIWHSAESTGLLLESSSVSHKLVLGTTRIIPEADDTPPKNGHDHRCVNCAKLLGKENYEKSSVEIKCHRCGEFNTLSL